MKNLISVLSWFTLFVVTVVCISGCRTKKIVSTESDKRTYDSVQVVKENADVKYSLIDTTKIDNVTTVIREYIFDTSNYNVTDSFAHDTNVGSKAPMMEFRADGSVKIFHGLEAIKERKESRRNEKKGISERKDSTSNKISNTNVGATENKKRKDKQIERVQVSEPFRWWQFLFALCVPFAVIVVYLYLRANPFVEKFFKRIRNSLKSE